MESPNIRVLSTPVRTVDPDPERERLLNQLRYEASFYSTTYLERLILALRDPSPASRDHRLTPKLRIVR